MSVLSFLVIFITKTPIFSTGCSVWFCARGQRLTNLCQILSNAPELIHDLVRTIFFDTTSSREQSLNRLKTAIRRRFVPSAFRFLISMLMPLCKLGFRVLTPSSDQ